MRRRAFLRATGVGAASVLAARSVLAQKESSRRPNLIFILADDAGIGDFGCYGQTLIRTPNVDRMAAEGMRFTQAYAGSAVCGPTRCVLMTGLHTGHCTRRDNRAKANPPGQGKDRGLVPLRASDATVAATLKKAGYATGGIGKWGLGNPGTTGVPETHGFDHFLGYYDQVHAHDYYTTHLLRSGKKVELPGNQGKEKTQYTHDLFEADTLRFIREHKDRPFFLYLPYTLPHGKYVIPSDAPDSDKPWPQQHKNSAAMITRLDATVGKILALLEELGLDGKTLVIFTSDNGPNRPFLARFRSAAGLRGIKRQLYEGGIRMPTVARWPGGTPAGVVSDFVWSQVDVLPTAAELAGVEPPKNLDGISILPTLLGKKQKPHDHLYWEIHSPFHQAVRAGRWKGIRFGTEEALELYDLSKDPGETRDVAGQNPDAVKKIEAILATARSPSKHWPAHPRRGRTKGNRRKKRKGAPDRASAGSGDAAPR